MAANVLADAGFLVALLKSHDAHHRWAASAAERFFPPWKTCEAALSEAFHVLGERGAPALRALLQRGAVTVAFDLSDNLEPVLKLLEKYENQSASLADACLVRMTELLATPMLLTTDEDFRVYRRHGRQVVPCTTPG